MHLLSKLAKHRLRPNLATSAFAADVRGLLSQSELTAPPASILEALSKPSYTEEHDSACLSISNWVNGILAKQMQSATSDAVYTPAILQVYDSIVWNFNSPFLWRIHADEIQALYQDAMADSESHAEIAVGTGKFLHGLPLSMPLQRVTLLDLNPHTLESAKTRLTTAPALGGVAMDAHAFNVLEDPPSSLRGTFDSVAANFLIHCLHGGRAVTDRAVQTASMLLRPEGVFFGSTILGAELDEAAGPAALATHTAYNQLGIFGNEQDCFSDVSDALHRHFGEVQCWRAGYCAVWVARRPTATVSDR